jgi:hypothetical protein
MITGPGARETVADLSATGDGRRTARALRAAADTIGQMPEAELQYKLSQIKEARKARTPHEALRQQAELDSLELDEAAYKLASQADQDGNLLEAARWYRVGAINDYAEAPLKLAIVLDSLAARYLSKPDSPVATREELGLVSEAALWYSRAFAAGEIEAAELLDSLIARHDWQNRATFAVAVYGSGRGDDANAGTCALGGLPNVVELQLAEAVAHCGSCRPCKTELVKVRRLIFALNDQSALEVQADRDPGDSGSLSRLPSAASQQRPDQDKAQLAGSSQNSSGKG